MAAPFGLKIERPSCLHLSSGGCRGPGRAGPLVRNQSVLLRERGRSSWLPIRASSLWALWAGPSLVQIPGMAGKLLVREDPAQSRMAPGLFWVEGQASIFPTPLPSQSYFQGLFFPGTSMCLRQILGPLASPFSLSPSSSHQPLILLCQGHLPDHPLCPHRVQDAAPLAWTCAPASAGLSASTQSPRGRSPQ